ncbi:MAG: FHA domain-containing protein [Myxococcales bacterium]|nr:FHA domain-containing protein [Myxococcales bacterium]
MTSGVKITIVDPRSSRRHEETFDRLPVRIGRHALNDCLLDASESSRFHARIQRDADGHLELVDVGSRNGTWLRGDRLEVDRPERLDPEGDSFRIGRLRIEVMPVAAVAPPRMSLVPAQDPDPLQAALLVLRRLADLYVPGAARLKTTEDVLAFGGRLRDALDALATHYALSPRPTAAPSPLHVLQGLLDAKRCASGLHDVDADLADAHLREQRLVRGFEQGLELLVAQTGRDVDGYLTEHGPTFGSELIALRERLLDDPTPEDAVA